MANTRNTRNLDDRMAERAQEVKERQPIHTDVLEMLNEEIPERCKELNYSGNRADNSNIRCSKCMMGVLHAECDNEG